MSNSGVILCDSSELYNILNQASQYPRLSDPNYLLLLDTRKRNEYNESHIITSKFAPRNDIGAFTVPYDAELETKIHVVVYDSNTTSTKDKGSPALSCAKLLWEMGSRNQVKVVKGGYEEFSALYPFLRTQKIMYTPRELDTLITYPVEVLPSFLYIGTYKQSQNKAITKDLKVKAHVNVTMEADKDQVLTIAVEDENKADLLTHMKEAVQFIDDHKTNDGRCVLIFSNLGISRSVTVAIGYLMWSKKISLKDAYSQLHKCRENMQPNRAFIEQLSQWEEQLFGKTITDISEPGY
ncbi:predicted protein [Nematostella vectensis]|uniref:Protein-serine/threonine phosphatase n=1 Tax=Nematostella vectensis TaxID=45351 RepID=A7RLU3_NEMVE|nr:predicted protein [Nematostella vectensis]|eukprot:XP_001639455.1 predicted protein [Nematostella vectensis]